MATGVLFLLNVGSACGKKKEEKAEPAPEPVAAPEKPAAPPATPVVPKAAVESATATLAAASESNVAGTVTFTVSDKGMKVEAKITGLTPGDHGFHVHKTGDCSAPDAKSAGGHYNPGGVDHGAPGSDAHHTGDLGNIVADKDGVAEMSVDFPATHLSLDAAKRNNIVGKAVIVHGGADDMKSQPSGNAGPRVGCGVIKAAE